VVGVGVEKNDLGEVSVEIGQVLQRCKTTRRVQSAIEWSCYTASCPASTHLDHLALDIPSTFPEQLVRQVRLERVELVGNGKSGLFAYRIESCQRGRSMSDSVPDALT
jgi:hypothetical protein